MDSANMERMLLGADNQLALPLTCVALLAVFVGCGRTPLDPGAHDAAVGGTGGGGAVSSGENNAGGSASGVTIFSPLFLGARRYVRLDSELGTATIPSEALANLESGDVVGLYTMAKRTVQAGGDSVEIWAGAEALTPNMAAAAELLLQ